MHEGSLAKPRLRVECLVKLAPVSLLKEFLTLHWLRWRF